MGRSLQTEENLRSTQLKSQHPETNSSITKERTHQPIYQRKHAQKKKKKTSALYAEIQFIAKTTRTKLQDIKSIDPGRNPTISD